MPDWLRERSIIGMIKIQDSQRQQISVSEIFVCGTRRGQERDRGQLDSGAGLDYDVPGRWTLEDDRMVPKSGTVDPSLDHGQQFLSSSF